MIRANNAQQETKMKKADQSCKKKIADNLSCSVDVFGIVM
jgi:hypothetical protein